MKKPSIEFGPEHPLKRLIKHGVTEEEKEKSLESLGELRGLVHEYLDEHNVELTDKQKQIMELADEKTASLLSEHDLPEVKKDEVKMAFLQPEDFKEFYKITNPRIRPEAKIPQAYYNAKSGILVINLDKRLSNNVLNFTETVSHELTHMKAYQAMGILKQTTIIPYIYRSGLRITKTSGGEYFRGLNEATTSEIGMKLAYEIIQEHQNDMFSSDIKMALSYSDPKGKKDTLDGLRSHMLDYSGYKIYRKIFNRLVKDISNRNKEHDDEEVRNIFFESMLSGRLLRLARLIDNTYGLGSFRVFANLTEENAARMLEVFSMPEDKQEEGLEAVLHPEELERHKQFRNSILQIRKNKGKEERFYSPDEEKTILHELVRAQKQDILEQKGGRMEEMKEFLTGKDAALAILNASKEDKTLEEFKSSDQQVIYDAVLAWARKHNMPKKPIGYKNYRGYLFSTVDIVEMIEEFKSFGIKKLLQETATLRSKYSSNHYSTRRGRKMRY